MVTIETLGWLTRDLAFGRCFALHEMQSAVTFLLRCFLHIHVHRISTLQNYRNHIVKFRKLVAMALRPDYLSAFLRYHVAAGVEHEAVLKRLPVTMVVDVGANRGQFSLVVLHCNPDARIVAFEPLPGPAAAFRALFANSRNVVLHEMALAGECGEMKMNVSQRDDSSSLLPITRLQTDNFPGTQRVAIQEVLTAPLGEILSSTDIPSGALLKIDVQGFELPVLKSAASLLPRFDWIYAECSFQPLYEGQALASEIESFLAGSGFRRREILNLTYARRGSQVLQADFLFENVARRSD